MLEKHCKKNKKKKKRERERERDVTKRCQETDKKGRENRRLHRVKILKYPLERY